MILQVSTASFSVNNKFYNKSIPSEISFKSNDIPNDSFEFSKSSLETKPTEQEKFKILNELLSKKLRNFKACIKYFKEESKDVQKDTTQKIQQELQFYEIPLDFLEKAIKDIDQAKTKKEADYISEEVICRTNNIIENYLNNSILKTKISKTNKTLQKGLNEIEKNISQIRNCYTKSYALEDVPYNMQTDEKYYNKIQEYIEEMSAEKGKISELYGIEQNILDSYSEAINVYAQKTQQTMRKIASYLIAIEKRNIQNNKPNPFL